MRRWSTSTNRKLRADARELQDLGDASHHGLLAAAGTAGVTSALCNSAEPASAASKARNCADGVLRAERRPAGGDHVRKRVGVSRGYGGECHFRSRTKPRTRASCVSGVMRARIFCSASPTASSGAVALQFHAGGFAGGGDFLFGMRLGLGDFRRRVPPEAPGFRLFFLAATRRAARRSRLPGWPAAAPLRRRALRLRLRTSPASTMSLRIFVDRAAKNGPPFLPIR